MSQVPKYYDDNKSVIPYYALHIAIKTHFAELFFNGDFNRIVYTTNENALRKRFDYITNNSNLSGNQTLVNRDDLREVTDLDFPFLNYKRSEWSFTDQFNRYSFPGFSEGVFVDDLGMKLRYNPNTLNFSGIFWTSNELDLVQANRKFRWDADGLTELLDYSIEIDAVEIPLWADFRYTNINYDPEYTDSSWLEKNKIHTIAFDIAVYYFDILPNTPIGSGEPYEGTYSLTEEVIFNYRVKNCLGNITDEEVYQLLYSELNP